MVLDNVDVCVDVEDITKRRSKCSLVYFVGLVTNRVDERAIHICVCFVSLVLAAGRSPTHHRIATHQTKSMCTPCRSFRAAVDVVALLLQECAASSYIYNTTAGRQFVTISSTQSSITLHLARRRGKNVGTAHPHALAPNALHHVTRLKFPKLLQQHAALHALLHLLHLIALALEARQPACSTRVATVIVGPTTPRQTDTYRPSNTTSPDRSTLNVQLRALSRPSSTLQPATTSPPSRRRLASSKTCCTVARPTTTCVSSEGASDATRVAMSSSRW